MQMDSQSTPTFFKVIIDASAPQLPLPPDFVTFHLKNKIPKDPIIIQSESGGYYWKLKIEKVGEFYCFTHGWNDIVKHIRLGYGDFLVFSQVDHSTFNVLIFSPNGCEKDLPSKIKVEHDRSSFNNNVDVGVDDVADDNVADDDVADDDVADDDVDDNDKENGDPFFTSTMTKTNRNMLRLSAEFVRLAGINSEGSMKMMNLDGEEFPIALRLDKSSRPSKRFYLSTGWLDFRRSNNLSNGDKCILKFLKSEAKLSVAKIPKTPRLDKLSTTGVVKRKREERSPPPREHSDDVDADVENEDKCVEVIKRPRGRPRKRQQGISLQQKSYVKFS